jgi:hypothetical protein
LPTAGPPGRRLEARWDPTTQRLPRTSPRRMATRRIGNGYGHGHGARARARARESRSPPTRKRSRSRSRSRSRLRRTHRGRPPSGAHPR